MKKQNTDETKLKEGKWIAYREGDACGVFDNRKEAVKWFKELLKQTLKDFGKQDKTDEYDYSINLPHLLIEPIKQREAYLGLL